MSTVRGRLGRLAITNNANCLGRIVAPSSAFSTFSGGGRGRGRGNSFDPPSNPPIGAAKSDPDRAANAEEDDHFPSGLGHGRGKPIPSNPILPAFSSWVSGVNAPAGRGGTIQPRQPQPPPPQHQQYQQRQPPGQPSNESQSSQPKKPVFFRREDSSDSTQMPQFNDTGRKPVESILPSGISSGLSGAGRGKVINKFSGEEERPKEENRHIRPRHVGADPGPGPGPGHGTGPAPRRGGRGESQQRGSSSPTKLSREEATKRAMGFLSRGGGAGIEEGGRGGRGRSSRGRGFRGRDGRGRGRGRGGRGRSDDDYATGLYLGDNADGERLAQKIGLECMNKLVEGFEETSSRVLPSPMDDAYLDALHTNNLIEYEPEYLMEEFGVNPDIDDTPPISLRDALEKAKPFLMCYENIQTQEEWEEIIEETMEKVPQMKELIDYYSGPDRVTAMQQNQELERVAATLPDRAPSSVKRFTSRALLSLQSNPGWGFDKKCQFMDKLAWEVSQQYK